jgi:phosphate transport system ATP-binding protein
MSNSATTPSIAATPVIEVAGMDFCYGDSRALKEVDLRVPEREVVAFIGPSGCGKSTLLRCFNRMNDLVPGARVTKGTIRIDGVEIHSPEVDPVELRRRIGMVFQ